ncbi:macrodomain Ori organization protein MaoP [Billgrantia sulfidoxydans]|uniref:Macrodomain Ori protein n=1 Tax=Billgrantia sulfidoxydans TaxID=2733484 RepID=A0ABX7W7K9_9GAMM|nr:DUF413 domain-containing protein [Halomonas sulfidoxydans]QTP56316.1 macrodomain Ori organization protein MaoP [Halomonas sulfidoxydans]
MFQGETEKLENEIFTSQEIRVIEQHGKALIKLALGLLPPTTKEQEDFVRIFQNRALPTTVYEKAMFKYFKNCSEIASKLLLLNDENEKLTKEIRNLKERVGHAEDKKNENIAESAEVIKKLREEKRRAINKNEALEERISQLETAIDKMKKKLSLIPEEEMSRILTKEKESKKNERNKKKEERVKIDCPCLGEVENCSRCYGSGSYEADGYGNPV